MTHKHMMHSEMLHTLKDFPDCRRLDNALGCASPLLCNGTQPPVLMLVLLVKSLFVVPLLLVVLPSCYGSWHALVQAYSRNIS